MAFSISNMFAQTMVKLSERTSVSSFESTFQQMQKTVIGRTNKEISKLEEAYQSGSRERDTLSKKAQSLNDDITSITRYLSENQSNYTRLEAIVSKITELQLAFGADGDSADVTATDISWFNSLRDELAGQVNDLYYLTHPDVVKPYGIIFLKEELSAIQGLTPTEGTATDATNQEISDYLQALSEKAISAMDATRSTISMSSKLSLRYQSALADVQTAIQDKAVLAQEELSQNVENLKVDASNLLRAISLTYDAQQYSSTYLSNALATGIETPKNSILNIFL